MTKRFGGVSTKVDDDDEQDAQENAASGGKDGGDAAGGNQSRLPTKENPVCVAIYGQICLAAKSYQSALCELSLVLLQSLDD